MPSIAARLAVRAIRFYQRRAPERIRNRCRFEPSCSDYAILAFQAYGAWRGLQKTIGRLARCRPPNGGEDYP